MNAELTSIELFKKDCESLGFFHALKLNKNSINKEFLKEESRKNLIEAYLKMPVVGYNRIKDLLFEVYLGKISELTTDELIEDYRKLLYFFPISVSSHGNWHGEIVFIGEFEKKIEDNRQALIEVYKKLSENIPLSMSLLGKEVERKINKLNKQEANC